MCLQRSLIHFIWSLNTKMIFNSVNSNSKLSLRYLLNLWVIEYWETNIIINIEIHLTWFIIISFILYLYDTCLINNWQIIISNPYLNTCNQPIYSMLTTVFQGHVLPSKVSSLNLQTINRFEFILWQRCVFMGIKSLACQTKHQLDRNFYMRRTLESRKNYWLSLFDSFYPKPYGENTIFYFDR